MKGAVLAVLCAVALTRAATVVNENGCPGDYKIEKLLPHAECDKFYYCVHGNLLEMVCAPGLHFDSKTSRCDFPVVANCQRQAVHIPNPPAPIETNNKDDSTVAGHGNPSEAPAICAAAESDGVLVAHENCRQFYKCSFGIPVPKWCPSNLLYDFTVERCEWPETVECKDRVIIEPESDENEGEWVGNGAGNDDPSQAAAICSAEGSDHIHVAHEYCNMFYQCWAGRPVALYCPEGFIFNPAKDYCDFPGNVECNRGISENQGNNNQGGSNDNTGDEDPIGNNYDDPSQAPAICSQKDFDGILVAHENCNQFYKCTHGAPVAQICPGNLLFDPTKDRCEWPESVSCGNRIIPEINDNDNGGSEWVGNGAGNDDPSLAPAICAAEGSDHVHIAHEYCNMFYQCWAGQPVALYCPEGFIFNPIKDYCDFPYNVECIRGISENQGNDNQGGSNDNTGDEDPIGNDYNDPSQAPAICSQKDFDGILVAHENCNQFYKCTHGAPVAQICPGNLLFDPTKDRCEWPESVNCGNRIIPEINDNDNGGSEWVGNGAGNDDPSLAPAICAAEGSDHVHVAHEDCDKFYQCWAGQPFALNCPPGFLFNPYKDYCDFPYNVDCGNRRISKNKGKQIENTDVNTEDDEPVGNNHNDPSQAPAICRTDESDGVLVAHENCNQFYVCLHGVPVARTCWGFLLFDPKRDRCEWRETVECGNRVIPDVTDNDNGGNDWTGNGAGNHDPSQAAAICAAEGSDNVHVAHENCNQFYQCWAGQPFALNCPSGFLFNPDSDYCDYPYNVDCGNRRIYKIKGKQIKNTDVNTEDDEPVGNNHNDPSQAPAICRTDESDGVLVAHENCNQFYVCLHGVPVARTCWGFLLFDPKRDRCEWRETVECGNRVIPDVTDNDNGGNDWTGNGAGNHDPSQAAAICAAEGSDNVHVAHENCNQFYQCWAGQPFALNCPSGFLFNPDSDYCDYPYNVDCGNRRISKIKGKQIKNTDVNTEDDEPVGNNHNDPSQAPAICRTDESDGVLVAHENCNQFYVCLHGVPVARTCWGFLLFDPKRDRCEWRETVECGNRVIPDVTDNDNGGNDWTGNGAGNHDPSQAAAICAAEGSDNVHVAHENCNQFYQCWAGQPFALNCPSGFLFNPDSDYCDYPYNVDCGNRQISKIKGKQIKSTDVSTEDDEPVGNNHNDPSQAPAICRTDESDGVLVAHENCNQFYVCLHGTPVARTCWGYLLFDPRRDRCEWRETVECGNRVIPDVIDNDNGGNDWTGNGAGNHDPSQAAAICAAEGSDNVHVAHENCNQFYQCWAGQPFALNCPSGFLFNPDSDYCDYPYNVDCGNRRISENKGKQIKSTDVSTEDDEPVGNNHNDPSQAPAICRTDESDGVLVAHENCNQFYVCLHGTPVARTCWGYLLFDPRRDRCEWRETVECGNRVIPDIIDNDNGSNDWTGNGAGNHDPSQAAAICAAEGSDNVHVAHENCNQFYQCWAGQPFALNCPSGFLFNPDSDYCDYPYNVDCGNRRISENKGKKIKSTDVSTEDDEPVGNNHNDPSQAPAICRTDESDGVLIAHENCNQFYVCLHGVPVARTCWGYLLFDPRRDRCEWRETVECGNRVIPDVIDNDNGGNDWTGNGAGNHDPSQAAAICAAEGSDNVHVAHENCNQFYQCWAGQPFALNCPSGFLFNPDSDYCDYPYNVDCGNRIVS